MIPDSFIQELLSRLDVVEVVGRYVSLKKAGANFQACCPFHSEKTPSFTVSPAKQFYHCFGCGAGGNVFGFIMRAENIGFTDAVKTLAERAHYQLPEAARSPDYEKRRAERARILAANVAAARYYYDCLNGGEGKTAVEYLNGRGVTQKARRRFGLGFAPGGGGLLKALSGEFAPEALELAGLLVKGGAGGYRDRFWGRLMFPIFDELDKLVGFGGRVIGDGAPKYLNTPDTPVFDKGRGLYALNTARKTKAGFIVIVEGYMDVIALHQNGFDCAVAALGTALTANHARLLSKYSKNAVVLFDGDEAGEKAALRAIPLLAAAGVETRALTLPGAKDPDEYIKSFGREAFAKELEGARHYARFQIQAAKRRFDLGGPDGKAGFSQAAAEHIAKLDSPALREAYISETAAEAGLSEAAVAGEVKKRLDYAREKLNAPAYAGKPAAPAESRADDEARRGVLAAMAKDPDIKRQICEVLNPWEFVNDVYVKLFLALRELAPPVYGAAVASRFETEREQAAVASVFANAVEYADIADFVKALNQQIRAVKLAYITARLGSGADVAELNELLKAKKTAESAELSYITNSDG
jgi:DNA primase